MSLDRSSARYRAISESSQRRSTTFQREKGTDGSPLKSSEIFGQYTFSFDLMEEKLASQDVELLRKLSVGDQRLTPELADKVAIAAKEWALSFGATHYCHWFQPQTGSTAEKHDSFFSFDKNGNAIEKFTGKLLAQAEPDASSFPSGGVRATFEARGYTAWDASSPMFLMESENGLTLCIPSVFISYGGQALDHKTPLLRSVKSLSQIACETLELLGKPAEYVIANAGPEQEYFVVDETLHTLRPDLVLTGRTLLGRTPPKHQQLDDHYFGSMKQRVLNFIMECEDKLYRLGVPIKTRHNEVAPAQYEAAPIFENANVANDHNQLAMEILRQTAKRHGLVTLFHEKPYADINGSGKHVNWSMQDSHGNNLLEPGDMPEDNIRFLYFLCASVKAVHDHGDLLRMSIASTGNDFRLGANEAPPAIMSVFLGQTLSAVMDSISGKGAGKDPNAQNEINLDLARVPVIQKDNTDRNRTSPFAFTGNKFEFRAVGSSANISASLTIINAAVTNALNTMNERLREKSQNPTDTDVLTLLKEIITETESVRFEGDNYSEAWQQEAAKRGLPNLKTCPEALAALLNGDNQAMLEKFNVLSKEETASRYNVLLEQYISVRMIELGTLHEMLTNQVLPAAFKYQKEVASSLEHLDEVTKVPDTQKKYLESISATVSEMLTVTNKVAAFIEKSQSNHDEGALATAIANEGMPLMDEARAVAAKVELMVDDCMWSLPKFRELLFSL